MFISELSGMVSIGTLLATGLDGDDFTTGVGIICLLFTIVIWAGLCCIYCEGDDFELDSDEGGHCGVIKDFSGWGNGDNAWLVRTSKFICTSLPFCIIGGMYSYESAGAAVLASAIIGVLFCAFAVVGSCSKGTDGEKWSCINCERNGDNSNGNSSKSSANSGYFNDGTGAFSIGICDEGLAEVSEDFHKYRGDNACMECCCIATCGWGCLPCLHCDYYKTILANMDGRIGDWKVCMCAFCFCLPVMPFLLTHYRSKFKDYYNIPNDSEWTNFVEVNLYYSCAPGQMLDTVYNDPNFKPYSIAEHGDYSSLNEICCKEMYKMRLSGERKGSNETVIHVPSYAAFQI